MNIKNTYKRYVRKHIKRIILKYLLKKKYIYIFIYTYQIIISIYLIQFVFCTFSYIYFAKKNYI